jgi:hypothetical protein
MSKADQWVVISVLAVLMIHGLVLIAGLITNRLSYFAGILNLIMGMSVLIYWIQKQLRIEYHIFEMREWVVLLFEAAVAGISIYSIFASQWTTGFRVLQYIFFGIHSVILILLLIFMLTFKMDRLF